MKRIVPGEAITIGKVQQQPVTGLLYEKQRAVQDESGYRIELDEVFFNQIYLKWGTYINPQEKVLSFHPGKAAVVSHFLLNDSIVEGSRERLCEREFVVYREYAEPYDLFVTPTRKDKARRFFELNLSPDLFNSMVTEESDFLLRLRDDPSINSPSPDFTAAMAPAMYALIGDMQHCPYTGYLKGLYLEAKATELFLLQVSQMDRRAGVGIDGGVGVGVGIGIGGGVGVGARRSGLRPGDIESLREVKRYLEGCYDSPCSLAELARKAGINVMKLKSGFKELFGTTVMGYFRDIRLEEARRMLLEEKLYVNEVADRIGYKHPHHFTAAFKRKFGVMPRELRR
jgi:AraC-like DNA-binding protein